MKLAGSETHRSDGLYIAIIRKLIVSSSSLEEEFIPINDVNCDDDLLLCFATIKEALAISGIFSFKCKSMQAKTMNFEMTCYAKPGPTTNATALSHTHH